MNIIETATDVIVLIWMMLITAYTMMLNKKVNEIRDERSKQIGKIFDELRESKMDCENLGNSLASLLGLRHDTGGKTMERLTRSANDGAYTYTACEATIGEILGRLTEYEDTGMTPEEVDDLLWKNEWHDARECTPIECGIYWVTINEDGMRSVGTAEFRADWVVSDLETIEAWMPMQK